MRILNVTQSYAPFFEFGGPPVKVRALAEGLARKGHEVTVLTADWGLDRRRHSLPNEASALPKTFGHRLKANGVTAVYLANWFHFRAMSWNPALRPYLRASLNAFDVVHIFGLYDLLGLHSATECRKRKIPYVVEPMGMFLPIVRNLWLKRLYHQYWGYEMLTEADAIIATSEQERDELVAGGLAGKEIVVRRNGLEVPAKFPEQGRFRNELKIPQEAQLILFLGRLSKKKSPDLLLRAFADLKCTGTTEQTAPHLAFVGPDESGMKAGLQKMANQLRVTDRVHCCPPLDWDAKWAAYRDADIFVLPSQNENFGNSAAEAAAAGTPVIVTEQCGIAPLLKDVAGLVVKHDVRDLRQALQRLLEDRELRRNLQNGCAQVVANLSWAQPLQQMEVLYRTLAGGAHS